MRRDVRQDKMADPAVLALREVAVEAARGGFSVAVPELQLHGGAAAALLGPSGCGKSSLLLGLLGLRADLQRRGAVAVVGRPLPPPATPAWRHVLRHEMTLVPQDAHAALDPVQTVQAQLHAATGAQPPACAQALQQLGVADAPALLRRPPHRISGGQAQRVLLAIALLRRSPLLIADEPSANLDAARTAELVQNLRVLRGEGTGVLVATHDHDLVTALAARTYVWRDGAFVPGPATLPAWPRRPALDAFGDVVLACEGVGVRLGASWILRDVSFDLRAGEILALVGPSGAGKSTLARVLAGHRRATVGKVQRPAGPGVQLLFQDAYGSLTPHRTLQALVAERAAPGFDIIAQARALGLDAGHLRRRAAELSGGERRRAALLRALSVRPRLLILDEPTASLDRATAVPMIETLLAARARHAASLLLITHDRSLAEAVAHRVLTMAGGRLC